MLYVSTTFPDIESNLAFDEALLLEAEANPEQALLRIWNFDRAFAVVLGAGGKLEEDVFVENCQQDRIPICRRSSGGGTVLLGPGCLLYTLVLPFGYAEELEQIGCSYCYILGRIKNALEGIVSQIDLSGTSDLAIKGKKFSGNSQQRKRNHLLHHGTILYDFPLEVIGRYLKQPTRQPDYRQDRGHKDFLTNLATDSQTLEKLLQKEWKAFEAAEHQPKDEVKKLVSEKYSQWKWVSKR